ncbi:NfeD family protein [Hymenobacter volaticus]|uniref:NfeD family protein n=1 Tax=Hymenobacter volaticus TaxID=2932254 RepID=A0ABY4G5F7_9BACT|nr:NfeD family protein [Hymenobacter volaticus]UOQ66048.1 NfeD family protein [Hymenobacter volaticus]
MELLVWTRLPLPMDWLTIALLLLFGLLFLVAEVIFIPGTTVVGLIGFALLAAGIWFGYRDLGAGTGHILLVASLAATGILVYIGLRPRNISRVALNDVNNSHVRDVRLPDVLPGTVGRTLSALRPAGTVLFEDDRREVTTRGEYVAAGTEVRVLRIEQNRIVVESVA